jgi:hypothetical protein
MNLSVLAYMAMATNMLVQHEAITQLLSSGTIKPRLADCDQWSTALTRRRTYLATSPGDLGAVSLLRWSHGSSSLARSPGQ